MSTPRLTLSVIIYYSLLLIASVTCFYFILVNFIEIKNRVSGVNTYFSQRTWLSDNQAIIYLVIWQVILAGLLIALTYGHFKERVMTALYCSGFIIILLVLSFYIDSLFYSPLP